MLTLTSCDEFGRLDSKVKGISAIAEQVLANYHERNPM